MTNIENINKAYEDAQSILNQYNEAFRKGDLKETSRLEEELSKAEDAYNEAQYVSFKDECLKAANPVKTAIIKLSYKVLAHTTNRDKDVVLGLKLVENRVKEVDLVRFCTDIKVSTEWRFKVEKFNQLLAMRTGLDIGLSADKVKAIHDSFTMNEIARELDMGKTPTSNTQVLKQLQMVVDAIIYEDKDGSNAYKVSSHDVAALLTCYGRFGTERTIKVMTNKQIHSAIVKILNAIVTGKGYELDYKKIKNA